MQSEEEWWKDSDNVQALKMLAHSCGSHTKALPDKFNDEAQINQIVLFPTFFPRELFELACAVQMDFNTLMDAVSVDHSFLKSTLDSVSEVDEFTKRIFQIYEAVREDNLQTCQLCVFRSDYMLGALEEEEEGAGTDGSETASRSSTKHTRFALRQIELNTVAVCNIGLFENLAEFHSYVNGRYCPSLKLQLPENRLLDGVVDPLACAWRKYGVPTSGVLMVVSENEQNEFDQRAIEFRLWKRHHIPVIRRTLPQLTADALLSSDRRLHVSGMEIAIVYYRSGYMPAHYPTEKEWGVRLLMERSRASLCPSAAFHLAGTKKVQQALAAPGVVERFIKDKAAVERIRSTFAGLYTMELGKGEKMIKAAIKDPQKFVVKPQREGGGNNYFGSEVRELLEKIRNTSEQVAYILMDRVFPPVQPALIMRPGVSCVEPEPTISELGIFGCLVKCGDEVLCSSQDGHILRTKVLGTDEGGVSCGAAALDSPNLIPMEEFVGVVTAPTL